MADTTIPEYKPKSDSAPKGRASSSSAAKKKRTPPKATVPVEKIREDLTELFVGVGVVTMMRNEIDGLIIVGGSPDIVDAWCDLAEKNPWVHFVLQKFTESGDWAKVASTTLPLVLALASNHGRYNGPLLVPIEKYVGKAQAVVAEMDEAQENREAGVSGSTAA